MSPLPDYKTISELFKKGMTIEAQEQIMTLREAAVSLKEENANLRDQVNSLKAELDIRARIEWSPPYYYLRDGDKKDGPFCQCCYDKDKLLIRLQMICAGSWTCHSCDKNVTDGNYNDPFKRKPGAYYP